MGSKPDWVTIFLVCMTAAWYFDNWPFGHEGPLSPYEFAAEVGYFEGGSRKWWVDEKLKPLDLCRARLSDKVASLGGGSSGRVFSQSCQIHYGDKFLDRTR